MNPPKTASEPLRVTAIPEPYEVYLTEPNNPYRRCDMYRAVANYLIAPHGVPFQGIRRLVTACHVAAVKRIAEQFDQRFMATTAIAEHLHRDELVAAVGDVQRQVAEDVQAPVAYLDRLSTPALTRLLHVYRLILNEQLRDRGE